MKKLLIRWYYRMFYKGRCFKASLSERQFSLYYNKGNIVEYGDLYLGKDWWYRARFKSKDYELE